MDHCSSTSGINEEALLDQAQKYKIFQEERVENGFVKPVGEGVMIWDEVKVYCDVFQYILLGCNSYSVCYRFSLESFGIQVTHQ